MKYILIKYIIFLKLKFCNIIKCIYIFIYAYIYLYNIYIYIYIYISIKKVVLFIVTLLLHFKGEIYFKGNIPGHLVPEIKLINHVIKNSEINISYAMYI